MLTDFYELTMANGYFEANMKDDIAYFDMFFRRIPDDGGYANEKKNINDITTHDVAKEHVGVAANHGCDRNGEFWRTGTKGDDGEAD